MSLPDFRIREADVTRGLGMRNEIIQKKTVSELQQPVGANQQAMHVNHMLIAEFQLEFISWSS